MSKFFYYKYDLPDSLKIEGDIAIDCEAMGLKIKRDRLCVVQIGDGKGNAHVVHFPTADYSATNLKKLLSNEKSTKIFHYARFDVAIIKQYLDVEVKNIFCTKIASKLSRTYTDHHGLKELCNELLDIKISKYFQSSDWGKDELVQSQIEYAGSDVLYLHSLKQILIQMLNRSSRMEMAQKCFDFLNTRVDLDLEGWDELDIFAH